MAYYFPTVRISSALSISPPTAFRQANAYNRVASSNSYLTNHCRISQNPLIFNRRVGSPLATEVYSYEHSDEVTFNAFLVLHCSGEGEAYRDAENSKKKKIKVETKR
jgi:hypothetical protein